VLTLDQHTPSHILTVYQRSDPSEEFIAKKVDEGSNELKIFKLLNTFRPKSEHIISLHESFQTQSTSWIILPKLNSLPGVQLDGRVVQVCQGLIKGIAYLHEFCIAHRDIKPENLVVDWDYTLKIIDFDVAMRVDNENDLVGGQCGTKGWMAPEIKEKSKYSPIKADLWSTGQVLLYLLNKFRTENMVLKTIARRLSTHDPERRSLIQVAAPFLDVANIVVERKASPFLRDTVEFDGEDAKAPKVKKQKLLDPERTVALADLQTL
jgi:serine/threonine protein kinase